MDITMLGFVWEKSTISNLLVNMVYECKFLLFESR